MAWAGEKCNQAEKGAGPRVKGISWPDLIPPLAPTPTHVDAIWTNPSGASTFNEDSTQKRFHPDSLLYYHSLARPEVELLRLVPGELKFLAPTITFFESYIHRQFAIIATNRWLTSLSPYHRSKSYSCKSDKCVLSLADIPQRTCNLAIGIGIVCLWL